MGEHITMADVARRVQVHQTTVSLALRNDPRLPIATRERIRQIAREMDYRPNPLVSALISERRKGLASGRGSVLAFLTSGRKRGAWRMSPTYLRIYERMEEHARARGYGLEEFWLAESGMTPERMRRILLHRGMRGIVVCPLQGINHALDFDFTDFSAVALGYTLKTPALDHVAPDYFSNMGLAIGCLLREGFRRIGFVTSSYTDERVNHLSLGCYFAERRLHSGRLLAPLILPRFVQSEIAEKLAKLRPDALLVPTSVEKKQVEPLLTGRLMLASLDCYENDSGIGVVRSISEEAAAAVSLVTSRLESARFGLPHRPQSILITGQWRGETAECPEAPRPGAGSPGCCVTRATRRD